MKFARYLVIFDREIGEDDGQDSFHNGTGEDAVRQFTQELQEATDQSGQPVGMFSVVQRVFLDEELNEGVSYGGEDAPKIADCVRLIRTYEDDPDRLIKRDSGIPGRGEQSDPWQL